MKNFLSTFEDIFLHFLIYCILYHVLTTMCLVMAIIQFLIKNRFLDTKFFREFLIFIITINF